MTSLLPPSATASEIALASVSDTLEQLPVIYRQLWNPDTCPAALLSYLAWTYNVDTWNEDDPEHIKRQVIKDALYLHRIKGSRQAVENVFTAYNAQSLITEWWETTPKGRPHTFSVWMNTAQNDQVLPVVWVPDSQRLQWQQPISIIPVRIYRLVIHVRQTEGTGTVSAGFDTETVIEESLEADAGWQTFSAEITGDTWANLKHVCPFVAVNNARIQKVALWDLFENQQIISNSDFHQGLNGWQTSNAVLQSDQFGLTADLQSNILKAIEAVKPIRSHFLINTAVSSSAMINAVGAARMLNFKRMELTA